MISLRPLLLSVLLFPISAFALGSTWFDIPAQPLPEALRVFAGQTKMQLLYMPAAISEGQSNAVLGEFDRHAALERLLKDTGFEVVFTKDNAATIRPIQSAGLEERAKKVSDGIEDKSPSAPTTTDGKSLWNQFLVAQVEQSSSNPTSINGISQSSSAKTAKPEPLQEVIVTAQKREERLQDVPVSVTAISAQTLLDQNLLGIQDYYSTVPGLSLNTFGRGFDAITLRGLSTGGYLGQNPTVGVMVDDVPFGTSKGIAAGTTIPDFDPSDLSRIEVLRGPQGTLYGASSIGGLIKFVTVDPSTEGFSGRVQAGTSEVHNGDQAGYNVRASLNAPVTDDFAVRISGFARRDPGYIDAPLLGERDINRTDVEGARFSALWRITDIWSLKLSSMFQNTDAAGATGVVIQPGFSSFDATPSFPGANRWGTHYETNSVSLTGALGAVNVVALTGFNVSNYHSAIDSPFLQTVAQNLYSVNAGQEWHQTSTDKLTQEIRLSGSATKHFDWLAGLFYLHEGSPTRDTYQAVNQNTGEVSGLLFNDPYPTTFAEYAAFADLTWHFTDKFDIQVGGRESHNDQRYHETISGPDQVLIPFFGLPSPIIQPLVRTSDSSFTYLFVPQYKINSDSMIYGRFASGYQPGGPNSTCEVPTLAAPCVYKPSKTYNYELGSKTSFLNRRLSVDASVYYIDWRDMQLSVLAVPSGATFYTNGSKATSEGLELSVDAHPAEGVTATGWITLSDAKLVDALPPSSSYFVGNAGDRLPYSSKFSANLSMEDEFPLTGSVRGFAGGIASYVGPRESDFVSIYSFESGLPRERLAGYTNIDLRAGARYELWSTTLYVNNVADRRGALFLGYNGTTPGGAPSYNYNYITPRTIGLELSKKF